MTKWVGQVIKESCLVTPVKKQKGNMPLPISIAHHLVRYATEKKDTGEFKSARPDMKAQVTIDYTESTPKIDTILMSIQHDPDFDELNSNVILKKK